MSNLYPIETLDEDYDDGTMPDNVDALRESVVGHRIVSAEKGTLLRGWYGGSREAHGFVLTLDNGRKVLLEDTDDCCAYTELSGFLLDPGKVDHVITGVGTTDGYSTWHVYADAGDILKLDVEWSAGNPFYYGYGFNITVQDAPAASVSEPAGEKP